MSSPPAPPRSVSAEEGASKIDIRAAVAAIKEVSGLWLLIVLAALNNLLGGVPRDVTFRLVDRYDAAHGISAMMRATAFSLSITGQMQADGRVTVKGVHTPDEAIPFTEYVRELGERGVRIEEL